MTKHADGTVSHVFKHVYAQDPQTAIGKLSYKIVLTVSDSDGEHSQLVRHQIVKNIPPTISNVVINNTRFEAGDIIAVTGTIQDTGLQDALRVIVDWGDGTFSEANVDLQARTFMATHTARTRTAEPFETERFRVNVKVSDEQGSQETGEESFDIEVAAPPDAQSDGELPAEGNNEGSEAGENAENDPTAKQSEQSEAEGQSEQSEEKPQAPSEQPPKQPNFEPSENPEFGFDDGEEFGLPPLTFNEGHDFGASGVAMGAFGVIALADYRQRREASKDKKKAKSMSDLTKALGDDWQTSDCEIFNIWEDEAQQISSK